MSSEICHRCFSKVSTTSCPNDYEGYFVSDMQADSVDELPKGQSLYSFLHRLGAIQMLRCPECGEISELKYDGPRSPEGFSTIGNDQDTWAGLKANLKNALECLEYLKDWSTPDQHNGGTTPEYYCEQALESVLEIQKLLLNHIRE